MTLYQQYELALEIFKEKHTAQMQVLSDAKKALSEDEHKKLQKYAFAVRGQDEVYCIRLYWRRTPQIQKPQRG